MRLSIRRLVVLGLAALAASATLPPAAATAVPDPADSTTPATVYVTHSASFERRAVWGGLLALFTVGRVSDEHYHPYSPWTAVAADGLQVRMPCSATTPWIYLRILFVGDNGPGGNQINVAMPRLADTPSCVPSSESFVEVLPGDGRPAARGGVSIVPLHPGAYYVLVPDPRAPDSNVAVPSGLDLDTDEYLTACVTDATKCPVTSAGRTAKLRLYTTGADALRDRISPSGFKVVLNRLERENGIVTTIGPDIRQPVDSVTATGSQTEEVVVSLPDITTAGEYRIRMWNDQTGFATQDLRVYFG